MTSPATLPFLGGTEVSQVFFGADNVEALQQGLRYGVYRASGGKLVIDRQSDDELLIVMRSVFLQYSRNLPGGVLAQVQTLNSQVLDFCVNRTLLEVRQHLKYSSEVQVNPVPVHDRGLSTSQKGTRVLEMRSLL
jgi:hypothetical protein